jgi:hypothetical protein
MTDQLGDQVIDTSIEIFEAIGDQFFEDSLFKDIPILGTAVNVAKLGKTITDRIFLRKVANFLVSLSNIKETERKKFYSKLETDQKLRDKTGEVLVLILDRFDDLEKPEILSKIFMAYIKDLVNFDQFRQLASAVDLAYIEDLKKLIRSSTDTQDFKEGLLRTGLTAISQYGLPVGNAVGGGKKLVYSQIKITDLGNLFIEIMIQEEFF